MKLLLCPKRIECIDEDGEVVFSVEAIDDGGADVTITELMSAAKWDQIAPLIRQALVDLRLASEVDAT